MSNVNESRPVKFAQMMCSPAHTYGNAIAFFENWLIRNLPQKSNGDTIFKTINISSKIAHRQIRKTTQEISKNRKPAFMLRPRIDYNEDRFLKGTILTDRLYLDLLTYGSEGLRPFFFDRSSQVSLKYKMNRTVLYVDVLLVFSTYMEKANVVNYIMNRFPLDGRPFDIDAPLESYLDIGLMEMVSEISGVPIEDETGSVRRFLQYMNSHSCNPVTYKLQGSSNTKEFYRYYHAKMITAITQFDPETDGERTNMISDNFPINMTFRLEFYTTGMYFLFSDKVFDIKRPAMDNTDAIIPIFTDTIMEEDLNISEGWYYFNRASCMLTQVNDVVCFKTLLSPSIIAAIEYYLSKDYYLGEIVDIRVRRQGEFMNYGKEYDVDFKTMSVRFHNNEYGYYTYSIIILIKPETINELIKKLLKLE